MPEDRIGLIGICTFGGPIGPSGNHLRWSFPSALGFPPKGFHIYRKPAGVKDKDEIDFSGLTLNVDLPDDLRIHGVEFIARPAGRRLRCSEVGNSRVLTITPSFQAQLELRFPQSIAYVQVQFAGSGSSTLRAYQNERLLASVSIGAEAGEVSCAGITRLIIDLGLRKVRSIGYATETSVCNDPNWTLIKTLSPMTDVQDPLSRLEDGLFNYYARNLDKAKERYEAGAAEIVLWLRRLLSPTGEFFEDPEAQPHLLKIRSAVEGPTSSATYLQSVFLLAALDPNIARLMSLYWVDAFKPPHQQVIEPPKRDRLYDYKVEGRWKDGHGRCGLLLNIGQPPAPQPSINGPAAGKQLGGLRWINGQPLGRLGLKWPRPVIGNGPQARFVQPVLYEITRFLEGKGERIPEPVLVDNQSWTQSPPALYVDRDLALGEYTYEVRPIDLFGQLGSAIKSPSIKVADLEAPPPPIRTRVELSQAGAAANLRLQFEFGASQHQQAPDVRQFLIYWRADTLLTRALVRVVVTSNPDGLGRFLQTLRMKHSDQTAIPVSELKTFVGDVLTNVITDAEPPLPAHQRRRYRIAAVDDSGTVVLEPTATKMTSGLYELVQDPHNRHTWTRLQQQTVSSREPISGVLQEIRNSLPVEVLSKRTIPSRPDPFASIPPERRGRQFPNLPPPAEVVEVEVNRLLTEPDVFAGGRATTSADASIDVIYVVSNAAAGQTRIAFPAAAAVAIGDTLTLSPPSEVAAKVQRLRISGAVDSARLLRPGGEIAFEREVDGQNVTVIMRVISNAVNRAGAFDLVVRADDAEDIGALHTNVTRVRYYAPYVLSIPLTLAAGSNAPIALPILASNGYRDGFIAVSATDKRNSEGPLGAPAQFSVIRPRPTGAPSRPYPCTLDKAAPAGYASPPNRAGRATICLTWDTDTLVPADGARYEVARALDNSILTAHLRDWQVGKIPGPVALPVIAGQTVEGSLEDVTLDSKRGLIRATFEPATSVAAPAIFRNGRLVGDRTILRDGHLVQVRVSFQVTLAKSAGAKVDLLLRGPSEPLPSSGAATLQAPPNYSDLRNDILALKNLATDVPDAFALVTGVPIESNRFIDDVAGKGRNVFFYRVRAVDAAENRSDWSAISAPFHQVDTTPPEAPREFQVFPGDRSATLMWLPSRDAQITGYRVYRAEGPERDFNGLSSDVYSELKLSDLQPRRLNAIGGILTLPRPLRFIVPSTLSVDEIGLEIASELVVQELVGGTSAPNLFDSTVSRPIFDTNENGDGTTSVSVTALTGLLLPPNGSALRVSAGSRVIDSDPAWLAWTDQELPSGARFTYRLAAVKGVRVAPESPAELYREIPIVGSAAGPIRTTVMDFSVPGPPAIESAEWVDEEGAVLTNAAPNARVRLIVQGFSNATRLLVQRRADGEAPWTNPVVNGNRGWQELPSDVEEADFFDTTANPGRNWTYRALICTGDGRLSNSSATTQLMRLAP